MTRPALLMPPEIESALDDGSPLLICYSGGKDSDVLLLLLSRLCQERAWPLPEVVHCDLGAAEWFCTEDYVRRRNAQEGLQLHVVRNANHDLLQRIQRNADTRPQTVIWPSAAARFCTSEEKTAPTNQLIARRIVPLDRHRKPSRAHPLDATRTLDTAIVAMGLRAQESPARAKKPICRLRPKATTLHRTVWDWNPLHALKLEQVWDALGFSLSGLRQSQALCKERLLDGQSLTVILTEMAWPWHPAYLLGNDRLSCSLCVLASLSDILNGIAWNVPYYVECVRLEARSGFSFKSDLWLGDLRQDLLPADVLADWLAMRKAPRPILYPSLKKTRRVKRIKAG